MVEMDKAHLLPLQGVAVVAVHQKQETLMATVKVEMELLYQLQVQQLPTQVAVVAVILELL
jgi:hypothetical protein